METIIDTEWGLWLLVKWDFSYHKGFIGTLASPPEPEEVEVEIHEVLQTDNPEKAQEDPYGISLDVDKMDLEPIYEHLEAEEWEKVAEQDNERAEEAYQNWKESRHD